VIANRRPERHVAAALGLAAGLAAGALATSAQAQYFGGNKVRYEDPDFRVLSTEHFDIYTYAEEDAGAADAAVMMERWHGRLSQLLEHELSSRQPLILYAGHPHFRQTNATPGLIGEGTGGFTEMFKRRIVLPFAGAAAETDHVLGHELVHAYQFDIILKIQQTPEQRSRGGGGMMRLPLWFIEGMAEYLSIGSVDPHTAMWMRDSVVNDDLPTVAALDRAHYFPYRYGHAFWAYVGGRYGDAAVARLLRTAYQVGDVRKAIKLVLKVDHKQLSKDWQDALKQQFGPAVAAARPAADLGRALVAAKRGEQFNVSPVLSPDGKRLLFFSEREQFSIELYLLDVESGKVLRRVTSAATDPHLDSLQFLSSAGTWSPDGRRIAIGGVGHGRPVLTIVDAETGDTVAEHRFPDLVEVVHPAWSPDGKYIAFAGNKGGLLQLHLFELATGEKRLIAPAPYAALQPAWSPDGKYLAFVTDRFTSDAKRLTHGDYRLARLDLASGAVTPLPGLVGGKNSNPQWSPDGAHIYFLSDARGGPNLYRLDVASGGIEALTDVKTGLSGLTRLSPALSVASQAPGRIAASVFDKGMYHIYLLENLQGRPVTPQPDPAAPRPGQLPPRERVEPAVDGLLASTTPAPEAVQIKGPDVYNPLLGVDAIGQVGAVVGTSSTGTFVGGGVALQWSDMLGDHNLLTLLQLEGNAATLERNTAAIVNYQNRENRWRWGVGIGQVPSLSVRYETGLGTFNGQPAQRDRLVRQYEINREVAGRVAYPFTRADRIELAAGYRHISYVTDAVEAIFSTTSGALLAQGVVELPSPPSIELYPVGVAFVHDTSLFGGTAPAAGQRYRLELGGAMGDLAYYAPLADFRQYFLVAPYLSLGARALYYGRFGSEAEDPRLGQVYVGDWSLVRGYGVDSFRITECDPAALPACPVYDQLFGSRIALASAEARVPIFGARGLVRTPQAPPIDIAAFYDAGAAWTKDEGPSFLGGPREVVRSYGASIRMNLFGAFVLQWNYVDPLDRPQRDWYWEFLIAPGF